MCCTFQNKSNHSADSLNNKNTRKISWEWTLQFQMSRNVQKNSREEASTHVIKEPQTKTAERHTKKRIRVRWTRGIARCGSINSHTMRRNNRGISRTLCRKHNATTLLERESQRENIWPLCCIEIFEVVESWNLARKQQIQSAAKTEKGVFMPARN